MSIPNEMLTKSGTQQKVKKYVVKKGYVYHNGTVASREGSIVECTDEQYIQQKWKLIPYEGGCDVKKEKAVRQTEETHCSSEDGKSEEELMRELEEEQRQAQKYMNRMMSTDGSNNS